MPHKEKIKNNSLQRDTPLGRIVTNKEVVVHNEKNTKHTFLVIDDVSNDSQTTTITNIIVVETDTGDIYEYFLKYTFDGGITYLPDGTVDLSQFTGTIETFNYNGDLLGNLNIVNGEIASATGAATSPCPEDSSDNTTDDNTDTDGATGTPGGTGDNPPDGGNDDGNTFPPGGGGGSGTGDNQEITDPDIECGLSYHRECNRGYSESHSPRGIPPCTGNQNGNGIIVITDCNGNVVAQGRFNNTELQPCGGTTGVLLDDECFENNQTFNDEMSEGSPFNVDFSAISAVCDSISMPDTTNQKFLCIYNKLTQSPTFKNLFIETFGESKNLNVKFELVDNLTYNGEEVNGLATRLDYDLDQNGNLLSIETKISINKDLLTTGNPDVRIPFLIAKTIIHECIHAYLYVKILDCGTGSNLIDINEILFEELVNLYFDSSCSEPSNQHDFMIDFLLPTMQQVLSETKDLLIPQNQQDYMESIDFLDFSNMSNGPLTESTPFTWEDAYYYVSLEGLQSTDFYSDTILTNPIKLFLRAIYTQRFNTLSKNCVD